MKHIVLALSLLFCSHVLLAQERIDGNMDFQSEKGKKYSIYVPTSYDTEVENRLMVALHPWNTARWGAKSWCDTLVDFAEKNGLLVLCTDGGSDGKVDDAIDTAFTSTMLDSMRKWYNVDQKRIFLMGFSWGARTTYTYGLSRPNTFAGFMPIGAAISLNDVPGPVRANAKGSPWYVIHGSNDAPATRYTPLLAMLNDYDAITETNYLAGVGHTIDFSNRNKILTKGFRWLDSVNTEIITTGINKPALDKNTIQISHSTQSNEISITSKENLGHITLTLYTINGQELFNSTTSALSNTVLIDLPVKNYKSGMYILSVSTQKGSMSKKIMINTLK